ncbi:MAG: hypothetical protein ACRD2C_14700 [Acidimicrobiales bacterium]
MSDSPQGPGWWQASDDRWYPPPRPEVPDGSVGPPDGLPAELPSVPMSEGPPGTPAGGVSGTPSTRLSRETLLLTFLAACGFIAVVVVGIVLSGESGEESQEASTTEPVGTAIGAPNTSDTLDEEPDETAAPTTATEVGPEDEAGSGERAPTEGEELGDGIVLLEYGSSTVPALSGRGRHVTIGMIIENTSDQVRSPSIEWITYDDSGSLLDNNRVSAFTIQPGETLGLGDTSLATIDQDPVELEIRYEGDMGFSTTDTSGSVTVSSVESTLDASTGFVDITFEVASSYGEDLTDPYAHVIYRNSAGEIVGGTFGGTFGFIPAEGSRAGEVMSGADLRDLDVDLEQTSVYVDAASSGESAG